MYDCYQSPDWCRETLACSGSFDCTWLIPAGLGKNKVLVGPVANDLRQGDCNIYCQETESCMGMQIWADATEGNINIYCNGSDTTTTIQNQCRDLTITRIATEMTYAQESRFNMICGDDVGACYEAEIVFTKDMMVAEVYN